MVDDEYADLIGDPTEAEPPSPFDVMQMLLDAPEDVRHWGMRKLVEADPSGGIKAVVPEYGPLEAREFLVELKRQRRTRHVRQLLDEQEASPASQERPELTSLTDFLAEPDDEVRYRVDRLWPTGGRIVLAAQNKSGKTTLTGNLLRSLADGDAFLGSYVTEPVDRVVLVDNEMSPGQIRRWLRDQGIRKTDTVELVSLRGRLSSFNILDPAVRAEWAELLGSADVLVFDCLRPALDALGLSEDKESGRFLEALDELTREAGIGELLLVHHMGHSNERSRGDSRLEDWPDAKWKLVKADPEDPESERYFAAFGRDVDQPESRLAYDPADRHLTIDGGSRRQARAGEVEVEVLAFVADHPGCSGRAIEDGLSRNTNDVRAARKALIGNGELRVEPQGQKRAHFVVDPLV